MRGEEKVVQAMQDIAELAAAGREALCANDVERLHALINANYDARYSIYKLADWQVQMVETARACGASAKFAGSGGAIIGTYDGEAMFEQLVSTLGKIGSRVIRPQIYPES